LEQGWSLGTLQGRHNHGTVIGSGEAIYFDDGPLLARSMPVPMRQIVNRPRKGHAWSQSAVEMGDEMIGAGMVMLAQSMNCPARGEQAEEHATT
jgi:hypothetical protein